MSRACDAIGCSCPTASGRFMCRKHWFMVPADLQRVINTRYRACRKEFGFLSDPEYLKACTAAIQGIAKAEGRPAADDSYARLLRGVEKRAAKTQEESTTEGDWV